MTQDNDMILRIHAVQATQVGPSDEWSNATKSGYNQAATDIAMNIMKVPAAPVTVGVKPLVWVADDEDPDCISADKYDIYHEWHGYQVYFWSIVCGEPHKDLSSAQAWAWNHHKGCILAALDVTAPDAMAGKVAALVEAAEVRLKYGHDYFCGVRSELERPCSCGEDALRAALADMKGGDA
jgi:hypothetical protein